MKDEEGKGQDSFNPAIYDYHVAVILTKSLLQKSLKLIVFNQSGRVC